MELDLVGKRLEQPIFSEPIAMKRPLLGRERTRNARHPNRRASLGKTV